MRGKLQKRSCVHCDNRPGPRRWSWVSYSNIYGTTYSVTVHCCNCGNERSGGVLHT